MSLRNYSRSLPRLARTPSTIPRYVAHRSASNTPSGQPTSDSSSSIPVSPSTAPPLELKASADTKPNAFITAFASLLGYTPGASTAIRSTNFYYDNLSQRHETEAEFWYGECGLPRSFTAWFHITNLHIYLLTVRFRALPHPLGRYFNQQLINHFFIDAEFRLQQQTSKSRVVNTTLKDCLSQYHGSFLAYDEAIMTKSDAVLASALWRNIFGADWAGYGSPEGDKAPKGEKTSQVSQADIEASQAQVGSKEAAEQALRVLSEQAQFAVSLEKLVEWVRKEIYRLDQLPDELVAGGKLSDRASPTIQFTPISATTTTESL